MIRRTFMGISLMSILNLGNTKEINRENKASKAIVIYFSRKGMNYWHGDTTNLAVGNTARMAKIIQEATGADGWEIQPVHSYPSIICRQLLRHKKNKKPTQDRNSNFRCLILLNTI